MGIIPQKIIDKYLAEYNSDSQLWSKYPELADTRELILDYAKRDRAFIHQICFSSAKPVKEGSHMVYLATAGPPAAGKSTILEQEIARYSDKYAEAVRVDPDVYGMRAMLFTYHSYLLSPKLVAQANNYQKAQERAYDVARPWSNVVACEILNMAFDGPYSIVHGTTMTNDFVNTILRGMKLRKRTVDLLLCSAPMSVRIETAKKRVEEQADYHGIGKDLIEKSILFPQRFPLYFELADNLTLFWRNSVQNDAITAATYSMGEKICVDKEAFDQFWEDYASQRSILASGESRVVLPEKEELEARYLKRFRC